MYEFVQLMYESWVFVHVLYIYVPFMQQIVHNCTINATNSAFIVHYWCNCTDISTICTDIVPICGHLYNYCTNSGTIVARIATIPPNGKAIRPMRCKSVVKIEFMINLEFIFIWVQMNCRFKSRQHVPNRSPS